MNLQTICCIFNVIGLIGVIICIIILFNKEKFNNTKKKLLVQILQLANSTFINV